MRRLLVFGIGLLTFAPETAGILHAQGAPPAQMPIVRPQNTDDALIVGTTTLKLGMVKNDVVRMLSLQYDVKPEVEIPEKLRSEIPENVVVRAAGKDDIIALLNFGTKGVLESASKLWTPAFRHYSDGEIGRMIVALWGTLPDGVGCKFITGKIQFRESRPPFRPDGDEQRDAVIECGHKRIRFSSTTVKGDDSLGITEEIDAKGILEKP